MLSRRKLFSMLLMMAVLLALYMFTEIYLSATNDYEVGGAAGEVALLRADAWEADGAEAAPRQTALVGSAHGALGQTVAQWCTYSKRPLRCYASLSGYLAAGADGVQVLCVDPAALSLPADAEALEALTQKGLTIVFCALPDAEEIARSPGLQAVLGIKSVRQAQAALTGVYLYDGFLVGGEALYGQNSGMEVKLEIPWYELESGTKVYLTGLTRAAEDDEGQDERPAILWRNNEGSAKIYAVNGDFLEDETGFGLLDGMLAEGSPYLLRPVVNAQNLTVAGYPSFAAENTRQLQEIYASSHKMLLQNTVWPNLIAATEQSGFRMTCYMTTQLRSPEGEPQADDLAYYLRQFKERRGEAGRCADGGPEQWAQDTAFLSAQGSSVPYPAAYVGTDAADFLAFARGGDAQGIRTVTGDCERPLLGYLTETVTYQGATHRADRYGFREDLKNRSLQTALAYTNILLEMERVTWPETAEDRWENYSREIAGNLSTWWKPYSQFDKTTAAESDARLRAFLALDYEDELDGDTITLTVRGREGTVSFLLRTHDQEVQSVSGGTAGKVEKGCWLVSVEEDTVRIALAHGQP